MANIIPCMLMRKVILPELLFQDQGPSASACAAAQQTTFPILTNSPDMLDISGSGFNI